MTIFILRITFCLLLLMLAFTSGPKNYGESQVEPDSTVDTYSSSLNPTISIQNLNTSNGNVSSNPEKAVIIMFDRGYDTQFTNARPILDKYGFKASFFIICSFIEGSGYHKQSNGTESRDETSASMSWDEIRRLYKEGHDIESHGTEHRDLRALSLEGLEYEVSESKKCLTEEGLKPTFFQFPSNKGNDNATVVQTVSKFWDFGLADHSRLMFLNCDGWVHGFKTKSYKNQYDCNPYSADGIPTRTNKYSIREWSHDREHSSLNDKNPLLAPQGAEISDMLFTEFVRVVEEQGVYNNIAGKIVAIPIIGYHKIGSPGSLSTSKELFDKEMNYLHSNGFKVLKLTDLGYNDTAHSFYIK